METKANFALIGAATLIAIAAAMLFALWIARVDFNRAYDEYLVVFEGPVRGLARGAEVRFQGINVGEVTNLRINPTNPQEVLARIRIDAATPVRADSVGQLEPIGLTGVNLIQIGGGSPAAPLLNPQMGQEAPRLRGEPSEIDKLLGAGGDIAQRTSRALLAIQDLLTPDNVERVGRILADIEAVTESLAQQRAVGGNANEAVVRLGAAARSIEALSEETRLLLSETGPDARMTVAEAAQATKAIREAAGAGERALIQIESAAAIASEQTLPDFATAVQDIRRLTDAVERLAATVERNPSRFVSGERRPTIEVPE